MSVQVSVPSVEYRLRLASPGDDEPLDISVADLTARDLEPFWVGELTCCSLLGGFFIDANGAPWMAESVDEIKMSTTWLGAVRRILEGAPRQSVWAWEESNMTLIRSGDDLRLFDVHHGGQVVCPEVLFELRTFALQLAAAAETAGLFFDEVLAHGAFSDRSEVLRANLDHDWAGEASAIRALCEHPLEAPPSDALTDASAALQLGHADALRSILASSPEIVDRADEGMTLLGRAVILRNTAFAALLLECGASVEATAPGGAGPLAMATGTGHVEMVRLLLHAGADSNPEAPHPPMLAAAFGCLYAGEQTAVATELLAAGATLTLRCAVLMGDVAGIARLAHEAEATPDIMHDAVARFRQEAWHRPARSHEERTQRWFDTFRGLVDRGASPQPGLAKAILSEDLPTVRFALSLGARPGDPVGEHPTGVAFARQYGQAEIASLLETWPDDETQ